MTVNAPIYYNIGWWRFNEEHNKNRLQHFDIVDNQITFMNKPAVCFHVHTMKSLDYNNQGKFLVDAVFQHMNKAENEKYKDFFRYLVGLINE